MIKQALTLGVKVSVLAGAPEKLNMEYPNLKVIKGNVPDYLSVSNRMQSQEALLSALEHTWYFIASSCLSFLTARIK